MLILTSREQQLCSGNRVRCRKRIFQIVNAPFSKCLNYPQVFDFYFCHITSNIKYIKKDIKCETVSHFLKDSMVWAAFGHKDDHSLTNFSTDGDISVSQRLARFKIERKVSNIGVLVDVIISLEIIITFGRLLSFAKCK